jgi:Uma2 family endonuclease
MKFNIKLTEPFRFSNEEFFTLCANNPELRLEKDQYGNIILMSPTGMNSSFLNGTLFAEIYFWNKTVKAGKVLDSNGGITLPDGSVRAADVAFISHEKLSKLSEEEKEKFGKVCPDFIVELRSKSDTLKESKEKMDIWMTNGVPLGWLVDPKNQEVYIYKANQPIEIVKGFDKFISGEPILKGFEFDLKLLLS